jgi:hypothetical protein
MNVFEINVLNKNSIKQIEVDIFNKFKSDWCSRVSSSVEGCKLFNAWWLPAQVTNYGIIWRAFVHFHEQSHGFVLDCIYAGKVHDSPNRCITAVD